MYTGKNPILGGSPDHYRDELRLNPRKRPGRPSLMTSEKLWVLVQECWAEEAAKRPSFDQIQEEFRTLPEVI